MHRSTCCVRTSASGTPSATSGCAPGTRCCDTSAAVAVPSRLLSMPRKTCFNQRGSVQRAPTLRTCTTCASVRLLNTAPISSSSATRRWRSRKGSATLRQACTCVSVWQGHGAAPHRTGWAAPRGARPGGPCQSTTLADVRHCRHVWEGTVAGHVKAVQLAHQGQRGGQTPSRHRAPHVRHVTRHCMS